MGRTVWVNVVFRMGRKSRSGLGWWHFGLVLLSEDSIFEMGFTWFPHKQPFLVALRQHLLAAAVASGAK